MNASKTMSYEINLRNVRISYPHLFEPYAYQGLGKAKYSAKFLIHKTEQADIAKEIGSAMQHLASESYRDKKLPPADKLCLRDGDQSGRDEEAGYWVLSASETARPVVVNRDRTPLAEEDEVIFAGCRVNAKINLWAQDNQYGKRINANLLGVQFYAKDEKLGGGRTRQSAEEMFDAEGNAADFSDDNDSPFG